MYPVDYFFILFIGSVHIHFDVFALPDFARICIYVLGSGFWGLIFDLFPLCSKYRSIFHFACGLLFFPGNSLYHLPIVLFGWVHWVSISGSFIDFPALLRESGGSFRPVALQVYCLVLLCLSGCLSLSVFIRGVRWLCSALGAGPSLVLVDVPVKLWGALEFLLDHLFLLLVLLVHLGVLLVFFEAPLLWGYLVSRFHLLVGLFKYLLYFYKMEFPRINHLKTLQNSFLLFK